MSDLETQAADGEWVGADESSKQEPLPKVGKGENILRFASPSGADAFWRASVQRRGGPMLAAVIHFPDRIYGDAHSSLFAARVFRDTARMLLPPLTRHQNFTRLKPTNKSGIAGVVRICNEGGRFYWNARFGKRSEVKTKSFPIHVYGEEGAKKMAIAQREQWLQEATPGIYVASSLAVEDALSQYENEASIGLEAFTQALPVEELKRRIDALKHWFEQLKPHIVELSLRFLYHQQSRFCLLQWSHTRSAGVFTRLAFVVDRPLPEVLQDAWTTLQKTVIKTYGEDFWHDFAQRYREVFFSVQLDQRLDLVHRRPPPDHAALRFPPPALAALLPNLELPALPELKNSARVTQRDKPEHYHRYLRIRDLEETARIQAE